MIANSARRRGDPDLEADVFVPEFWVRRGEGLEQGPAGWIIEHDDLNAEILQPLVATAEGLRLTNDDRSDVELSNETRAVPAGRQRRDHHAVGVVPTASGFAEGIGFSVDGCVVFLDPAVVS